MGHPWHPDFTEDQLRCILYDIEHKPWQEEKYYEERRELAKMLREYFRKQEN